MGLPLEANEESNLYATITDEESNLYATINMRPWELRVQNRVPDPLYEGLPLGAGEESNICM